MVSASKKSKNSFLTMLLAVSLIVGTVVGAGVLGIPYEVSKSGLGVGTLNIIIIGVAATLMTLYVGELTLRTKEKHQLAGFAAKYLGPGWKYVMLIVETFGLYTAIIAYLVGVGNILSLIFPGLTPVIGSVIFFVVLAPLIYTGLRTISKFEMVITIVKMLMLLGIIIYVFPSITSANLAMRIDTSKVLMPFGIILFSMLGYSILPEIEEIMEDDKKKIATAVILAMIIVVAFYLIYTFSFVGAFGSGINEISMLSLSGGAKLAGMLFLILTLVTPYIAISTVISDVYTEDFGINKKLSWFITIAIPFVIVLFLSPDFVTMLDLSGTYSGSLMAIMSAWMVYRARKMKAETKPEYIVPGGTPLIIITILFFVVAMAYKTALLIGII